MPKLDLSYIELHVHKKFAGENQFLLLKRSPERKIYPNIWQPITGKIDEGETTKQAAARELEEETGINDAQLYSVHRVNIFYVEPRDSVVLSPVFLALTSPLAPLLKREGNDITKLLLSSKEMGTGGEVRLSDEHVEYKWCTFEEACNMIHWDNQIESLKIINDALNDDKKFGKFIRL